MKQMRVNIDVLYKELEEINERFELEKMAFDQIDQIENGV
jgi:hypothetical protein